MARHKVQKRTTTGTRGSPVLDFLGAEDLAASPVAGRVLAVAAGATAVEWVVGGAGGVSSVSGTAPIASSGGATPAISLNDGGVTNAKLADMAVDTIKGRATAGTGVPEDIACTAAGRAILDDVDAAAQRTTLGLGTLATQSGTFSGTSSGTNTGDQSLAGLAPTTRALTAGAGLTGGGDLSADRTFTVAAHVDGSIVVNADDVQVGVLATDTQHGTRGGGTQHANAVAAGAAGFMTGADKTKLDAISGTNTGDQTSVSGNAGTATQLQTARNINGVAFDGTANISIRLDQNAAATASVAFGQQQATGFRIENRTSDPGTPAVGELWLRTDL